MAASATKFRAGRDRIGKPLPGLYESDICRVERDQDGLWVAEIPLRRIGNSAFMEFRPIALGGQWVRVGSFRVRHGAMALAERMQSGELVFDSAVSRNGFEPVRIVSFAAVVDEIRKHQ